MTQRHFVCLAPVHERGTVMFLRSSARRPYKSATVAASTNEIGWHDTAKGGLLPAFEVSAKMMRLLRTCVVQRLGLLGTNRIASHDQWARWDDVPPDIKTDLEREPQIQ